MKGRIARQNHKRGGKVHLALYGKHGDGSKQGASSQKLPEQRSPHWEKVASASIARRDVENCWFSTFFWEEEELTVFSYSTYRSVVQSSCNVRSIMEPSRRHSRRDIAILRCSKLFFNLDEVRARETLTKKLEDDPADKSVIVRKLRDREVDDHDSYEELFPLLCVERGKNCNLFAKHKLIEINKIKEDDGGEENDDDKDENDDDTDENDGDDGEDDTDDEAHGLVEWPGNGFWSRIDANSEVHYLHVYPARKRTALGKLVRESAASKSIVCGWRLYAPFFLEEFPAMRNIPIKDVCYKFAISNPQSFSLKNCASLAVLRHFSDKLDRFYGYLPSTLIADLKGRWALLVERCFKQSVINSGTDCHF